MVTINNKLVDDIDFALEYFEPILSKLVCIIPEVENREDCKQELRMTIWKYFKNKEVIYNENYLKKRLHWNIINFLNRDVIYNFGRKNLLVEDFADFTCDALMYQEDFLDSMRLEERRQDLVHLIEKCKNKLNKKQYEALMLFLSGEKNKTIKLFYGLHNKNLTRYYINLGEAVKILKEEVNNGTSR